VALPELLATSRSVLRLFRSRAIDRTIDLSRGIPAAAALCHCSKLQTLTRALRAHRRRSLNVTFGAVLAVDLAVRSEGAINESEAGEERETRPFEDRSAIATARNTGLSVTFHGIFYLIEITSFL